MSYVAVAPGDAPPKGLAGLGALKTPSTLSLKERLMLAPSKPPAITAPKAPEAAAPVPLPPAPPAASSKAPMIVAGVVVLAAAAFFFMRRRKSTP